MADAPATGPVSQNKGGGFRGGPKRWTGRGPQPARHIPWPEIFKHHISLIEGHQKMIDMVRKHTVEGSGNHRQICAMLDRTKAMMQEAKTVARTFVPPQDHRDKVPLGSSSASMYPGYSPADHVYGTAAMEYGSAAAKARAQGIELKPEVDIVYEIGQGKGIKRKKLAEMRALKGEGSGSGSGSGTDTEMKDAKPTISEPKLVEEAVNGDQPAFFIDTKPTPVKLAHRQGQDSKESALEEQPAEEKMSKKAKKTHEGEIPDAPPKGQVETEDISAEVDARLQEKEEKRRKKEEQKRDEEAQATAGETDLASPDSKKRKLASEESSAVGDATEKPKKKKKSKKDRKSEVGAEGEKEPPTPEPTKDEFKRPLSEEDDVKEEGKKKRKSKKVRISEPGVDDSKVEQAPEPQKENEQAGTDEPEKPKKKKSKKARTSEAAAETSQLAEPAKEEPKRRLSEDGQKDDDGEGKKKKKKKRKLENGVTAA